MSLKLARCSVLSSFYILEKNFNSYHVYHLCVSVYLQMVHWRVLYTTSPPRHVLTLTVTPLPLLSPLLKVTMSFPTPCSPTTPRYPLTAQATLYLLPLLPLFPPTTSQAPLPPCHSTWPPSTRHCSTTCLCWAPTPCRGSTSTTFCRGWKLRGGE